MSDVLRLVNITKRFGALTANDNISLSLAKGQVLALLGENGAGKTTLMNILFGHYTADEGHVELMGKHLPPGSPQAALEAKIGMVHQHFSLAENLTVLENITLGVEPLWSLRRDIKGARTKLLRLSEDFGLAVEPDTLVGQLSIGEQQRVEILKALYRDANILILDEPTAVLTPQEAENLFATLQQLVQRGLSIIFITHKLKDVLKVSDHIAVLRRGAVVLETETKVADRQSLAEAMVGQSIAEPHGEEMAAGATLLQLENVTLPGYDGRPGLSQANLTLHANEIVGIAGVSGNGQSALADLISGARTPMGGAFRLFDNEISKSGETAMVARGVGRIPEDRNSVGVIGEMSIAENLISEARKDPPISKHGWFNAKAITQRASELIGTYDVRCPGPMAETRLLSGGNVQKLILARVLANRPKVILANQPVRGLDVGAIAFVHTQLLAARARGAGIILISEDLDELLALSDRIAVIYHGQLSPAQPTAALNIKQLGLMMSGDKAA